MNQSLPKEATDRFAKDIKEKFDSLAKNGCIGDPYGEPAYAYLRVSSDGQAEEGRSGLPRQIENCHIAASQNSLRVPWELVYADDDSGFEFRDRPELTRLRKEYKFPNRKANAIVMEMIDRLSRNADWHQGFLLDEMKDYQLRVVFWKQYNSRIERAVMGAISQEGMEQAKQRMADGNIHKAKDNRVTARVAAFGFTLVDRHGNASPEAKKDTHYAIHPTESQVVDMMYRKVGIEGYGLRRLAKWLDEVSKPPQTAIHWNPRTLLKILRNPVYKGEFYAHRYVEMRVPASRQRPNEPTRLTRRKVERPQEEWIKVDVPAIITTELWDLANRVLDRNSIMASRNGKEKYLLTGLLKCACCGYSYTGQRKIHRKKDKEYLVLYYRDVGSAGMMGVFRDVHCQQSQISCWKLDGAVWNAVSNALLHPEVLIEAMERGYSSGPNAELLAEIEFLEGQLKDFDVEDKDLYQAYRAHAFDAEEYAGRRNELKVRKEKTQVTLADLKERVVTREKLELNKQRILKQSQLLREQNLAPDPSFEIKRTILKLVVDQIKLNVNEGWFDIEGIIPGRYYVDTAQATIVSTSKDMDSSHRSTKSLREK
ncbi:MAG: recombinase family protein [Chloroflexi bacterium]|nr:recombinase family protein [Chloroflexota bacterium]